MRRSEYEAQALVNDGVNHQQAFDSQEGSAALLQANKPHVDGTDIQKAQFLADTYDKQSIVSSTIPPNPLSHGKNTKTVGKMKK